MSDDLIKQWDEYVESMGSVMGEVEHMAQQMRDRIEELERDRDEAFNAAWRNGIAREKAQAKLAKAVEALREIITRWDTPAWKDVEATGSVINRARAVLAELEGKENE